MDNYPQDDSSSENEGEEGEDDFFDEEDEEDEISSIKDPDEKAKAKLGIIILTIQLLIIY